MVIKNSSNWSTDNIRKLFRRCIKEVDKKEKPDYPFHKRNKHFQLDIRNSSYSSVHGRATINGYWISIKIPCSFGSEATDTKWKIIRDLDIDEKTKLARTIIHEYFHTIGCREIDYRNYKGDFTDNWNVDWVKDYPIKKKEIIVKEKQDITVCRYETAIKNLAKAETRLKRAKTIHNKWKSKVDYYCKVYNFN